MLVSNQRQLAPQNEVAFTGAKSKLAKAGVVGALLATDALVGFSIFSTVMAKAAPANAGALAFAKLKVIAANAAVPKALVAQNTALMTLDAADVAATKALAAKTNAAANITTLKLFLFGNSAKADLVAVTSAANDALALKANASNTLNAANAAVAKAIAAKNTAGNVLSTAQAAAGNSATLLGVTASKMTIPATAITPAIPLTAPQVLAAKFTAAGVAAFNGVKAAVYLGFKKLSSAGKTVKG